jgi:cellobionic acid phosphorylase
MVGAGQTRRQRRRLRRRWLSCDSPARELERVRAFWNGMSNTLEIKTPDRQLDRYVNRWLIQHVHTLANTMSVRALRLGFRNYVQDGIGMLFLNPAVSREIILTAIKYQLESGECPFNFYRDKRPPSSPKHVDMKIWLVFLVCDYARETGDTKILSEELPFWKSSNKGTVYDGCS